MCYGHDIVFLKTFSWVEQYDISTEEDQATPHGPCFNQWVFGYSDEGFDFSAAPEFHQQHFKSLGDYFQHRDLALNAAVGYYILGESTPAQCQERCQKVAKYLGLCRSSSNYFFYPVLL